MGLPVPYSQAITPVVIYPDTGPPAMFDLAVDERVRGIVPAMLSSLANELGRKHSLNAARTFIYNLVSLNGWQNNDYFELSQFAIDLLLFNMNKGFIINPYSEINNIANQAITLWSSRKVLQFPELRGVVDSRVISACEENSVVLNNLLQEIQSMYNNPYHPNQQMQNVPMDTVMDTPNGRMIMTPSGWQPYNPYGSMYQQNNPGFQNYNRPNTVYRGGYMGGQQPQGPGVLQGNQVDNVNTNIDSRFGSSYSGRMQPEPVREEFIQKPEVAVKEYTAKDWTSSDSQPYRSLLVKSVEDAVYRLVNGVVTEIVFEKEGNLMDRGMHRLNYVLNVPVVNDNRPDAIVQDSAEIYSINNVEKTTKSKDKASMLVSKGLGLYAYLDEIVTYSAVNLVKSGRTIHRCFGNIFTPIPGKSDYWNVIERIGEETNSFNSTAALLMEMAEATNGDLDALMYIDHIDRQLTNIINSFLGNNLSLEGLSIDSFSTDIGELSQYITKHFGNSYAKSLELFEMEFMRSFYRLVRKEDTVSIFGSEYDGRKDGIVYNFTVDGVSITTVNMSSSELEIDADKNIALMIQEGRSPVLYNIAASLFEQIKSLGGGTPFYNYMITREGARFLLYKGYLGADCYLIRKI